MHCQLDQVGQILNIASAAADSVRKGFPGRPGSLDFSRVSSSVIYGLLLLNGYDVFIQEGQVGPEGEEKDHIWVEVYFEGEAFVLDAAIDGDIIFLPKDEAAGVYGYDRGRERDWSPEDCDQSIWRAALDRLGIKKIVEDCLEEIMAERGEQDVW